MALQCLAILGQQNEPIYFGSPSAPMTSSSDSSANEKDDVFGFMEDHAGNASGVSWQQELMIHAALDRLEEILGSPKTADIVKRQRGTKWMGSLLPMEENEIYGYVTPSSIKILVMIRREGVIPLKKRKEMEIKLLFAHVHNLYIKYLMNPFTAMQGKVIPPSSTFERGVRQAMIYYEQSLLPVPPEEEGEEQQEQVVPEELEVASEALPTEEQPQQPPLVITETTQ